MSVLTLSSLYFQGLAKSVELCWASFNTDLTAKPIGQSWPSSGLANYSVILQQKFDFFPVSLWTYEHIIGDL